MDTETDQNVYNIILQIGFISGWSHYSLLCLRSFAPTKIRRPFWKSVIKTAYGFIFDVDNKSRHLLLVFGVFEKRKDDMKIIIGILMGLRTSATSSKEKDIPKGTHMDEAHILHSRWRRLLRIDKVQVWRSRGIGWSSPILVAMSIPSSRPWSVKLIIFQLE